MARLQIMSGKREGDFLDLGAGVFQIGTRRAAEINLRDKDIAYKHANVIVEGAGLFVEDLGSQKGVFVNGQQLGENQKARVKLKDKILVGSTELLVLDDSATGAAVGVPSAADPKAPTKVEKAPEPAPPSPAPKVETPSGKTAPGFVAVIEDELDEDVGGILDQMAADVEPEPAPPSPEPPKPAKVTKAAAAAPPPPPAAPAADTAELEAELRAIRKKLATKEQENEALTKALEGSTGPEEDDQASHGYMPSELSGDLETRVLELQQSADELSAQLLEKDQWLKDREAELRVEIDQGKKDLKAEAKKRTALEREVQRLMEAREGATDDEKTRLNEIATYEEANTQLVLENDELKERVEALKYQVEQEASRRGELVRERVRELTAENKKLNEANAELRTLVEAYEEKIDEIDERLEELEGENEELERLLDEVRADLAKTKSERETMAKTVRQKTMRLEERVQELEAENTRARVAGERAALAAASAEKSGASFSSLADGANGSGSDAQVEALRAKLSRLEALYDDAETVDKARGLEKRVAELEAESASLRKKLEAAPKDADGAELSTALGRVEELETRMRSDQKKLERLERKNRELVKANVAAEMARSDAEKKAQRSTEAARNA